MLKRHAAIMLTMFLLPVAVAGGNNTRAVQGETVSFNGAKVTTWAKLGSNGEIIQVGVTLPLAAVERTPNKMTMMQANFPAEVQQATFLYNVTVEWNPQGHEPAGRYTNPHFDVHYYTIDKAAVRAIDCKDLTVMNASKVPKGWLPAVPPGVPAQAVCVPTMGFHSLPATEFARPGQFQPGLFERVMIVGDYHGSIIFIEPMVTREALLRKQNFTLPVPSLKTIDHNTLVPTRFNAVYDPQRKVYDFVLSDFRMAR
ncbi:DUF5602 domain-containing protein [Deinococcus peraridilitoris]|uniref:TTHB210-like domain-containing protein n=1 Tax=Deinococcus peraridilitoris (strain DSM 19664 / LMG 22246 / CIP 109416 / KR-200) TaxID=937777 RepID=L0A2K2_DEIPD|nr:DUF5602 domain-containing protein [Deinococcus peraridilitoris]AFZ67240.1 hypothetical protein Deipe_1718 [Deinococcus peraridilitoris DSM 19664]